MAAKALSPSPPSPPPGVRREVQKARVARGKLLQERRGFRV